MNKKAINKNIWTTLLIFLIAMLIASSYGLIRALMAPGEIEEPYRAFHYSLDSLVEYEVYYIDNEFLPKIPSAESRAYITQLTDYIDTKLSYRFRGQHEGKITGKYDVIAAITAYTGTEKDIAWKETYTLVPSTSFAMQSNEYNLQKEVRIPFASYYQKCAAIEEGTKFIPDTLELVVTYRVDAAIETNNGKIEEQTSLQMIIPLRGSVYKVEGTLRNSKEDGIMKTRMVPAPMLKEKRIGFLIAVLLCIILLVLFLLMTRASKKEVSPLESTVKYLLRKYEDRIILVDEQSQPLIPERYISVKTFMDLIKVADELGKPILYKDKAAEEDPVFIVLGEDAYIYRVQPLQKNG